MKQVAAHSLLEKPCSNELCARSIGCDFSMVKFLTGEVNMCYVVVLVTRYLFIDLVTNKREPHGMRLQQEEWRIRLVDFWICGPTWQESSLMINFIFGSKLYMNSLNGRHEGMYRHIQINCEYIVGLERNKFQI